MNTQSRKFFTSTLCAAVAGAGFAFLAQAPAQAQDNTVDAVTVMGHYHGRDRDQLSMAVGYADLDLMTHAGRQELRYRVKLTARYVCDQLGESDTGPGTCRDAAVHDGYAQADAAIHHYQRTAAWTAGPVWAAPYPTTWVSQYPADPYPDQ